MDLFLKMYSFQELHVQMPKHAQGPVKSARTKYVNVLLITKPMTIIFVKLWKVQILVPFWRENTNWLISTEHSASIFWLFFTIETEKVHSNSPDPSKLFKHFYAPNQNCPWFMQSHFPICFCIYPKESCSTLFIRGILLDSEMCEVETGL